MLSHLLGAKCGGHIAFSRALPLSPKEPSHHLHTSLLSWSEYFLASGLFPSFSCTLCNKSCCRTSLPGEKNVLVLSEFVQEKANDITYTVTLYSSHVRTITFLASWVKPLSILWPPPRYDILYTHICMYKENWKATTCRELNPGLSSDYLGTTTRQLPAFVCL